jgi:hypothetical protein
MPKQNKIRVKRRSKLRNSRDIIIKLVIANYQYFLLEKKSTPVPLANLGGLPKVSRGYLIAFKPYFV